MGESMVPLDYIYVNRWQPFGCLLEILYLCKESFINPENQNNSYVTTIIYSCLCLFIFRMQCDLYHCVSETAEESEGGTRSRQAHAR